jgi:S-adenosylmethionine:tRNA ribosyltransferase-isomerase
MRLEDVDYHLPPELIAQYPAARRSDARMLVVYRDSGRWADATVRELPSYLSAGDLLVLNNSRVVPARLFGRRAGVRALPVGKRNPARHRHLKAPIEVLLVRPLDEHTWEALVRPGRKVRSGERLVFEAPSGPQHQRPVPPLEAEVVGRGEFGLRTLRFAAGQPLLDAIQRIGHVPLPPYIRRPDEPRDRLRYQTVYAKHPGSVAAPTAGLHFTRALLEALRKRGVARAEVTLHVSLGTFQPIHEGDAQRHQLHPESWRITARAAQQINHALHENRRIVAVGTSTVRTLEHVAAEHGGQMATGSGETSLFIRPGFPFRVTGGLLTNFHLPRTTLLILVAAFAGEQLTRQAYEHAVRERYRFYSYGDCMLIL